MALRKKKKKGQNNKIVKAEKRLNLTSALVLWLSDNLAVPVEDRLLVAT